MFCYLVCLQPIFKKKKDFFHYYIKKEINTLGLY
jgi:hypothetical protein